MRRLKVSKIMWLTWGHRVSNQGSLIFTQAEEFDSDPLWATTFSLF